MKILFLSFYYTPDLCAGSFRTKALVDALLDKMPKGEECHIDLITTMPNRYNSFLNDAPILEEFPRLSVYRAPLPPHKSGMLDQALAFGAFIKKTLTKVKRKKYDLVVATSSRLMTAALASFIARWKKTPLYLDIRDIYVDTINDILPSNVAFLIHPLFSLVERYTIRRADRINLVSEGFAPYFHKRYPSKIYSFFTNGIDDDFLLFPDVKGVESNPINTQSPRTSSLSSYVSREESLPLTVLYAGNIGEGQGLHVLLPDLAKCLEGRVRFRLIGDGGRRTVLEERLRQNKCVNVELLIPMKRDLLLQEYLSADILFLHLHAYNAFKKVLPSKIFEYAATGKPIWAGVSGYAAVFIRNEIENASLFPPCDVERAINALDLLSLSPVNRASFIEKFTRKKIMDVMALEILHLIN